MKNLYGTPKVVLTILLSCAQIFLSSCCPEFKEPIPPLPDSKIDAQLLGTWTRMTEISGKQQLSILPRKDKLLDIVYIYDIESPFTSDGANLIIMEGYSTVSHGQKFLCLQFRDKDYTCCKQTGQFAFFDKETGKYSYFIASYEVNNEVLCINPFASEKVKELINKGLLKGEITQEETPRGKFERVLVKSSSEELVKVISEKGVQIFSKEGKDNPMFFMKSTK